MQTVRELRPPRGAPPGCGDGEDGILAIENAFTPEECDRLSALLDAGVSAGGLAGGAVVSDIRACDIRWLDDDAETGWVFGRLARLIARANRELFGYDLTGFDEGAQVIRYTADRMGGSGGYDWHVDRGRARGTNTRKLSVSVQLSDPESYDGGRLELNPAGTMRDAPRTQGTAIVFTAFVLHRVSPLTRGRRDALVAWMHGPAFR